MDRTPRPGDLYRHVTNQIYQILTIATYAQTGEQLVVYQEMFGTFAVYADSVTRFLQEVDFGKYPKALQQHLFEKIERTVLYAQDETTGAVPQPKASACPVQEVKPDVPDCIFHGTGESVEEGHMPEQRPLTHSPAESRRALRQEFAEESEEDSYFQEKRLRRIEEREQRRGMFRKPKRHETATEELQANPCLMKFLDADTYEERFRVLSEIQDDITDRLIDDIAVVLDVVIPEGPLNDRYHQLRNIILTRQKYEINRLR